MLALLAGHRTLRGMTSHDMYRLAAVVLFLGLLAMWMMGEEPPRG